MVRYLSVTTKCLVLGRGVPVLFVEMAELSAFSGLKPGMQYWFRKIFWENILFCLDIQGKLESAHIRRDYTTLNHIKELTSCSYHPGWGKRNKQRSQVPMPSLQKFCKVTDKVVESDNCKKDFHATCATLTEKEWQNLESEMDLG